MNTLLSRFTTIDTRLTLWINQHHSPLLDRVMQFVTNIKNWELPLLIFLPLLFIFGKRRGRLAVVTLIITILISDNLTSYVLKPFFNRNRPFVDLVEIRTLDEPARIPPSPSFPSNHAANIFAMAVVLSIFFKKTWPVWFFIAGMVGYSRIYLGLHYFYDVLSGAIVGSMCALLVLWIVKKINSPLTPVKS